MKIPLLYQYLMISYYTLIKAFICSISDYGPAIIEHCLLSVGFPFNCKLGKDVNWDTDMSRLVEAFQLAEQILDQALTVPSKVSSINFI